MSPGAVCLAGVLATCIAGCATTDRAPGAAGAPPGIADTGKAIAIVGDTQLTPWFVRSVMRRESNRAAQQRLFEDLAAHVDELGVLAIVGDLVFTGQSRRDWRHFDEIIAPIARRVPVLPAIGNHDYRCVLVRICRHDFVPDGFLARFPWFAPGRPYVVPYGNIALVFIDSETGLPAQGVWLREWLREFGASYDWAVVLVHRPPHTDSLLPDVAPSPALEQEIVAAFEGASLVPVIVSGHAHGYEHLVVAGTHFIVTAGGGGPRGRLRQQRPRDVYAGRDCGIDRYGAVLRPLNYVMLRESGDVLDVTVRGFCKPDAAVGILEHFEIPRGTSR